MATPANPHPDPAADKPPRPRRWIPLSLRMFVAILSVLGGSAVWFGVPAYRQHLAVEEIKKMGGYVYFLTDTRPPTWLQKRVGAYWTKIFDEVIGVSLKGTRTADADLDRVDWPITIWWLDLSSTRMTDTALAKIGRLRALKNLRLTHTRVTDSGLANLKDLPNLRILAIRKTRVTDAGIADMRRALPGLTIEK